MCYRYLQRSSRARSNSYFKKFKTKYFNKCQIISYYAFNNYLFLKYLKILLLIVLIYKCDSCKKL
jgi:hypothetical protein